ncbi:RNA polymerase sigma-70 factor [Streptomyces sp. NPDC059373]
MDDDAAEFEEHRPRMFGLAYRMLGSASEAEDAVQDAYLRWNGADRSAIARPAAWLTKVTANLCLNRLTSARARRETYVGPWLPEPVLTGEPGPLEAAEQRESVSMALLTLMERLAPAERAVFVLREAFGHSHRDIAGILGIGEANSRQLHRRAHQRMAEDRRRFEPTEEHRREMVERFLDAARGGDLAGLESLLAEDVIAWSDGGGKVTSARRPVLGRAKVARFMAGLFRGADPDTVVAVAEVNAAPALLALLAGHVIGVLVPEIDSGGIAAIRTVTNPDKLGYLAAQLRQRPSSSSRPWVR